MPFALLVASVPLVLRRRAARQGDALRADLGNLNAEVVDGVQGLRELVSFGYQRRFLANLESEFLSCPAASRSATILELSSWWEVGDLAPRCPGRGMV